MTSKIDVRTFLANAPAWIRTLWFARKGLRHRQVRNMHTRINGGEPVPGPHAGAKRHMRYLKRS